MSTFMFVEQRGQDGYSGRTAVLHPDQHPLWCGTSHGAPTPTGSRSVFGSLSSVYDSDL